MLQAGQMVLGPKLVLPWQAKFKILVVKSTWAIRVDPVIERGEFLRCWLSVQTTTIFYSGARSFNDCRRKKCVQWWCKLLKVDKFITKRAGIEGVQGPLPEWLTPGIERSHWSSYSSPYWNWKGKQKRIFFLPKQAWTQDRLFNKPIELWSSYWGILSAGGSTYSLIPSQWVRPV